MFGRAAPREVADPPRLRILAVEVEHPGDALLEGRPRLVGKLLDARAQKGFRLMGLVGDEQGIDQRLELVGHGIAADRARPGPARLAGEAVEAVLLRESGQALGAAGA